MKDEVDESTVLLGVFKGPHVGSDPGAFKLNYMQPHFVTYRVVQKKGTVLLSTSLAWPAVAGCSRAEAFSQLSSISFAQPCTFFVFLRSPIKTISLYSVLYTGRKEEGYKLEKGILQK